MNVLAAFGKEGNLEDFPIEGKLALSPALSKPALQPCRNLQKMQNKNTVHGNQRRRLRGAHTTAKAVCLSSSA